MKVVVGLGNPGEEYRRTRHNVGFMVIDSVLSIVQVPRQARDPDQSIGSSRPKGSVEPSLRLEEFKVQSKLGAEIGEIREVGEIGPAPRRVRGSEKIILVKPLTYMNRSGEVVKKIQNSCLAGRRAKFLPRRLASLKLCRSGQAGKIQSEFCKNLFVVHDELDLPLGKLKIGRNISAAGHHGVESIIEHLGTQDFVRFRVGVHSETTPSVGSSTPGDLLRKTPGVKRSALSEDYLLSDFNDEEMKVMQPAIGKTAEAVLYAVENGVEKAMSRYN